MRIPPNRRIPHGESVSRRRLLFSLISAFPAGGLLRGQKDTTFSSDVKVVNVLATVRNKQGEIVHNLNKEDFVLMEDGRPQTVRYFSRETDLPLTLGLLVDTSMSQRRVLDEERSASYSFLDKVLREDKDLAFVIHFDVEVELLQDFTSSRKKLESSLGLLRTPEPGQLRRRDPGSSGPRVGQRNGVGTLLYDSVLLASDELMKNQSGRKAVIVLFDGVDHGSKVPLTHAIEAAQRADTLVYSILFADGTLSRLPRATCEIQGYVYDAKMRSARLARAFWNDAGLADRLEQEATELKRRFNRDFWLEDREFFALAIDGDGRKVDSLTSNIGHLLWSGIVEDDKAEAIVRHLMGPKLYSGWGVRTMAEGEGGYNPIGYHVGTVWPHDNSFIAMGLRRYGYREEAARVAMHMLEAATSFKGRLPEAFAGYTRELTEFPVEYPTACSPQAWASGTPLLLLRAILGLEPIGNNLLVDPAIPSQLGQLELLDIPGRWGRVDAFGRGRVDTMAGKNRVF